MDEVRTRAAGSMSTLYQLGPEVFIAEVLQVELHAGRYALVVRSHDWRISLVPSLESALMVETMHIAPRHASTSRVAAFSTEEIVNDRSSSHSGFEHVDVRVPRGDMVVEVLLAGRLIQEATLKQLGLRASPAPA